MEQREIVCGVVGDKTTARGESGAEGLDDGCHGIGCRNAEGASTNRGDAMHRRCRIRNIDAWIDEPIIPMLDVARRIQYTDVGSHDAAGLDIHPGGLEVEHG